jgi:GNAT superfamily N-acetyltransferase
MIAQYANTDEMAASHGSNRCEQTQIEGPLATAETGRIRPYRPEDRAAIRHICCETGFLGNPIDPVFRDRDLFADLFTKPYLDHEPDWALVAEVDGRVVGYLLGSVSPNFQLLLLRSGFETVCRMVFRLVAGRYAKHPRTAQFIRWLLIRGMKEQPRHPSPASHLHWDIDKPYRGRRLPTRLWSAYEQKLLSAGVTRCYGAFLSYRGRRPERAYGRYGFTVYDRKRTTLFEPEMAEPVDVVCVQRALR